MHDVITVGIPVLAILFGVLWNNQALRDFKTEIRAEIKDLRGEMKDLRGEMKDLRGEMIAQRGELMGHIVRLEGKIDRMQADLSQFYRILGEHGARLDNIEKR